MPPTTRNAAGVTASCSAYQYGLLVEPMSLVCSASTASSRPRAGERYRPTWSTDDATTTSTA